MENRARSNEIPDNVDVVGFIRRVKPEYLPMRLHVLPFARDRNEVDIYPCYQCVVSLRHNRLSVAVARTRYSCPVISDPILSTDQVRLRYEVTREVEIGDE